MHLINVENFSILKEKQPVIDNVNFTIEPGECTGLIGPSGSGKTLLAKSMVGLLPKTLSSHGSIFFENQPIQPVWNPLKAYRKHSISMIFQDPFSSLNPIMTIGDQLIEAILLYHQIENREQAFDLAASLLQKVKISDPLFRMKQYPFELSGGICQRVMIALSLISKPRLLIADEPTASMDVIIQRQIFDLIFELQEEFGMALFFISHDVKLLQNYFQRILFLSDHHVYPYIFDSPLFYHRSDEKLPKRLPLESDAKLLEIYNLGYKTVLEDQPIDVFQNLHLSLLKGQTLAIVGESGCGKSTLARAIFGLREPYEGSIHFSGSPLPLKLKDRPLHLQRRMQMIFQEAHLSMNPKHKIWEIITEPLALFYKMDLQERRYFAEKLLEEVHLSFHYLDLYPHVLSGGQAQRIVIARALSTSPELIICDEPISALDGKTARQILELLTELQIERKVSYIFISHDLHAVEDIAHQVAVMYLGQFVEYGEASAIFNAPLHPYTQLLLGKVTAPSLDPPSFIAKPKGCPFAMQCPFADLQCHYTLPKTLHLPNRSASCHLLEDLTTTTMPLV